MFRTGKCHLGVGWGLVGGRWRVLGVVWGQLREVVGEVVGDVFLVIFGVVWWSWLGKLMEMVDDGNGCEMRKVSGSVEDKTR